MAANYSCSSTTDIKVVLSSTKRKRRLQRLPGSATSGGPEYEWKLAGLLALRAYKKGLQFEVFLNAEVVRPFDDIVMRLLSASPTTYFVQLKHSKFSVTRKSIGQQAFVGNNGDFSLLKYFKCYEELRDLYFAPADSLSSDHHLLLETPFERMRFVLFTTKSVTSGDSENCEEDSLIPERDFPFHELFFTNQDFADNAFNFDSSYTKVWSALDSEAERKDIYQKEFLGKLKVFHKQVSSSQMDDLIKEEMIHVFGRNAAIFLPAFLAFLKEWSESDGYDFCLSNETLLDFFGHQLRQIALQSICKNLEFKSESLEGLRVALRQSVKKPQCLCVNNRDNSPLLRVVVQGALEPGLRAAKLIQAVLKEFGEDDWLYVDSSILNGFHFNVLTTVGRGVRVLITDVETRDSVMIRDLVAAVGSEVREVTLQSAAQEVKTNNGDPMASLEDEWLLSDLSDAAQQEMLQRLVVFQGEEMLLKDLATTWPTMRQDVGAEWMASKGEWIIGKPLENCEEELLPRHLSHFNMVSARLLTDKEATMDGGRLALGGFPKYLLECATRRLDFVHSEVEDEHVSKIVKNNARWTVINYEHEPTPQLSGKILESLARDNDVSAIHWVEYIGGNTLENVCMVWRGSYGKTVAMQAFVETITDECCSQRPLCNHLSTTSLNKLKHALLIGQAGLGKTTTFLRLAAQFKKENPTQWVVALKILQLRDLLRSWNEVEDLKVDHVVELLSKAAGAKTVTARRCLEAALRRSGAVTVVIDGVDEIAPAFKELTLHLLELLLTETLAGRVWVSSRPEVETCLRRVLLSPPLTLQPLTKEEQLSFLRTHMISTNGEDMKNRAQVVMDLMAKMDDLLGTPLHLQMAAEIFSRMNLELYLPRNLSLLNLYREFIKQKQLQYECKYSLTIDNIPLDNFEEKHQKCAIVFLFSDDSYASGLPYQEFKEYVLNNDSLVKAKEKFGIVWMDANRSLQFIHQTFAEYFAARWFLMNSKYVKGARHFVLRMNNPWREKSKIQLFLEDMLREDWPLHAAAWRRDMQEVQRLLDDGWGSDQWQKEDTMLKWSFEQYLLWAYEDSIYLYPEEEEFQYPWLIVALRAAAKSGCHKVVQEALKLASLPATSLKMALRDAVEGADFGHTEVARVLLENGVKDDIRKHERGKTALHLAAKTGNMRMLDLFVKHSDVNARDYLGHTPLHFAVGGFSEFGRFKHQHEATQRLLQDESVDVNAKDYAGNIPLRMAIWGDCELCVETLLLRGAHIQPGGNGAEELYEAASKNHLNVIRILLKHGVQVNTTANRGWTALHSAALHGRLEVVQLLLQEGADLNKQNCNGDSALDIAIQERHEETAKFLMGRLISNAFSKNLRGNDQDLNASAAKAAAGMGCVIEVLEILRCLTLSPADLSGALRAAAKGGSIAHTFVTRILLQHGAEDDRNEKTTILHLAAEGGNAMTIHLLLKSSSQDINARSSINLTPLHLAIGNKLATHRHEAAQRLLEEQSVDIEALDKSGNPPLTYAASADCVVCTETLLRRGANVNFGDRLPLFAAARGSCSVLRILLEHKAAVNAISAGGWTALHYAAIHQRKKSVDALLEAGADLRLGNAKGDTALVLTLQYNLKHMATFLMERTSNAIIEEHFIEAAKKNDVDVLEFLLDGGADLCAEDKEQNSALHWAASKGHAIVLQFLLTRGACVDAVNRKKETALHLASREGHLQIMELLVENGACINASNDDGNTPLHVSACVGNKKAVQVLLTKNANKRIKNKKDLNAFQLAVRALHWHCAMALSL